VLCVYHHFLSKLQDVDRCIVDGGLSVGGPWVERRGVEPVVGGLVVPLVVPVPIGSSLDEELEAAGNGFVDSDGEFYLTGLAE
jgi:hypothetical protein